MKSLISSISKPEGMAKARLVATRVAAEGDAWPLATDGGYVVEAILVSLNVVVGPPGAEAPTRSRRGAFSSSHLPDATLAGHNARSICARSGRVALKG